MIITYLIGVLISIILYSIVLGITDSINQFLRNKYKSKLNIDKFEYGSMYGSIAAFSFLWPIVVPTIIFCLFVCIIRTITSVIALKIFYLKDKSKKKEDDDED